MVIFRLKKVLIFDPEFEEVADAGKESLEKRNSKEIKSFDIKEV